MNATAWFLMVILIVANGYFGAVEFSLVASNRGRLEQLATLTGQARYRRALHAVAHLGDYIRESSWVSPSHRSASARWPNRRWRRYSTTCSGSVVGCHTVS